MTKSLNDRELAFRDNYLLCMNAAKAARDAGYAPTTADKKAPLWVGKSRDACPPGKRHVWDAVKMALQERSERMQIDADYVLTNLHRVAERCMNPEEEETFNPSGANKALELLGKHLGIFQENHNHKFDFGNMTDEQLRAIRDGVQA